MMCAPLEDRSGKVLGVIQVINRMNNTAFSDEDHEFLKQFSQIGGLVRFFEFLPSETNLVSLKKRY